MNGLRHFACPCPSINIIGVSATKKLSAEKIPAEECDQH